LAGVTACAAENVEPGAAASGVIPAGAAPAAPLPRTALPPGKTLRVQPTLVVMIPTRAQKTSWRWYGGIQTMEDADKELQRLNADLKKLAAESDFPLEFLPVEMVSDAAKAKEVASRAVDAIVIFGACSYDAGGLCGLLAASKASPILFLRHRTEPHYCQHVTAHWITLRKMTDTMAEPNLDVHDVAVDDYEGILWRLRALYGLKNARGTKMLAIGGISHYSQDGQTHAPQHATEVWGYSIEPVSLEEFGQRLAAARSDAKAVEAVERQTAELVAAPGVALQTERKFVFNSFLALRVAKELLGEKGASNFGFGPCMGNPVIGLLDTPPCLVLALANDEGYTAYCHTDLTHTVPGVLLRWISGKPAFVCNTHFPHDGLFTVAHCAAPRRMNGRDYEPTTLMTHYESDYGAATKVEYPKGQTVTVIIPAVNCSKWQGFRGTIVESPSRPACRSQMDIQVHGNWRKLLTDMVGFHAQVVYGDYLREVGYALKKIKAVGWEDFSEPA